MEPSQFLFWTLAFAGSILAGWWLAVRPAATTRALATPVSVLVLLMAVLLGMLAISGQDFESFTSEVYYYTLGR